MTDIKEVGMGNAECGKIAQKAKSIAWSEGRYKRMRKSASGLSEHRLYEPEAVGAIGAYAPEGMRKDRAESKEHGA